MDRIGVIGGTGLISIDIKGQHQDFLLSKNMSVVRIDDINAETEFGIVPLRCITIDYEGKPKELIFLQRHHNQGDANKPPHMINHKANLTSGINEKNLKDITKRSKLEQIVLLRASPFECR